MCISPKGKMKFFRIKTEADVAGDIGDFNINEEMKDMD